MAYTSFLNSSFSIDMYCSRFPCFGDLQDDWLLPPEVSGSGCKDSLQDLDDLAGPSEGSSRRHTFERIHVWYLMVSVRI